MLYVIRLSQFCSIYYCRFFRLLNSLRRCLRKITVKNLQFFSHNFLEKILKKLQPPPEKKLQEKKKKKKRKSLIFFFRFREFFYPVKQNNFPIFRRKLCSKCQIHFKQDDFLQNMELWSSVCSIAIRGSLFIQISYVTS